MTRGKVNVDPTDQDPEYYFGEQRGKLMAAMSSQELYARLADAYQLAGAMLIGSDVKDWHSSRNVNGWTDDEVDSAIEVLLNFLSCPAEVTKADFERVNVPGRSRPIEHSSYVRGGIPHEVAINGYDMDCPLCAAIVEDKARVESAAP